MPTLLWIYINKHWIAQLCMQNHILSMGHVNEIGVILGGHLQTEVSKTCNLCLVIFVQLKEKLGHRLLCQCKLLHGLGGPQL